MSVRSSRCAVRREQHGYYAQGVGETTAILPTGWAERLVPIRNANTRGATGWCLEPHDLVVAKTVAGREKDLRFLRDALRHGIVQRDTLLERLAVTDVVPAIRDLAERRIAAAPSD